ncbi:hypothetical protein ABEB36_014193 [Hypothenemus hampei]|uniref:Uncharacterized protein n=1 Tax=Hypothenemus hampei TaxID=57062 RepID=A0ABD1E3X7_HYPHA
MIGTVIIIVADVKYARVSTSIPTVNIWCAHTTKPRCPKNQKRCWYRIGSPPPAGSKNDEFTLRSVSSMVIAPARTGNDSSNKIAVIFTDHANSGSCSGCIPGGCILIIVEMKLIAPRIDDTPAI